MPTSKVITKIFFSFIIKCGIPNCKMCQPPRLHQNDFQHLRHLPDPMRSNDKSIQETFSQLQLSLDSRNGVRTYVTLNLRKFLSDSLDIAYLA